MIRGTGFGRVEYTGSANQFGPVLRLHLSPLKRLPSAFGRVHVRAADAPP